MVPGPAAHTPTHTSVPPRGLEGPSRGWSVSLHSGDSWQDLAGCDFVLDLIGQTEDLGDPADPHSYPIEDIPPAPGVQAPSLSPGPPPGPAPALPSRGYTGKAGSGHPEAGIGVWGAQAPGGDTPSSGSTGEPRASGSLDSYLDHIFEPVLSPRLSVSVLHTHLTSAPTSHLSQGSSSDLLTCDFCPFRTWSRPGL